MSLFALSSAHALSSAELQRFLDEALKSEKGSEVVIPPGRHELEKPLVIRDAHKLLIAGLDADTTILLPKTTAFELHGKCESVLIRKLTIEGGTTALVADDVTGLRVERCFFPNQSAACITLKNAAESQIQDCTLRDGGGSSGILLEKCREVQVRHLFIARMQAAVQLKDSKNCRVEQNDFLSCAEAVIGQLGGHRVADNESR
ncbi:MAG: right-handed parallel beta-helix repeat-containing protein [Verrucomicrobiaceae bacterium]|nr:right-handed parallel beta-helix repeat-containing protein [Verrucomicrobiaceae bacterium]